MTHCSHFVGTSWKQSWGPAFAFYVLTLYSHLHCSNSPSIHLSLFVFYPHFVSSDLSWKWLLHCSKHCRSPAVNRLSCWKKLQANHLKGLGEIVKLLNSSSLCVQSNRPNCRSWLCFQCASPWQECRESSACLLAERLHNKHVSICQLHFLQWTDCWTQRGNINRPVWDVSFPHY